MIGADGPHFAVARITKAVEYLGFDSKGGAYFFYWPKPAIWNTSAYPYDAMLGHRGKDVVTVFQCGAALLKGRFDVWAPLVAIGKQLRAEQSERVKRTMFYRAAREKFNPDSAVLARQ